jgi:hypothetical protein
MSREDLGKDEEGKIRKNYSDAQIVLTVYSHLSRLFVSNYTSFFTLFAGFVVFVYAVLLPLAHPDIAKRVMLTVLDLMILGSAFVFCLRTRVFSKAMQSIENNYLVFSNGMNVHNWLIQELYPKKTFLDKIAHFLFERPEKIFAPSEMAALLLSALSTILTIEWIWTCPP